MLVLILAAAIDFARVFPPLATQQAGYRAAMTKLETYRGRVSRKPLDAIEAYNIALESYARLDSFFYLHTAIDTTDTQSQKAYDALNADFESRTAFFVREVSRIDRKRLGRYAHFADMLRVPPAAEAAASTEGDRAAALIQLARAGNVRAKTHGYTDAAEEAYARKGLTKRDVVRLLDAVAAETPRYRSYLAMRAGRASSAAPRYTLDDVRAILPRAAAPFGAEYVAELARLLDPANGRIDSGPGEHRRRGGFSKGYPGFDSVFYIQAWNGTYNDLRVMAHESTHAIQHQLEARHGVPAVYIDGPKFLSESYAMVLELLLPDMLAKEASDPARRQFFLEQFLDSKGIAIIFRTAAEAALEQAIYDDASIRTADDLDALAARVAARFAVANLDWKTIRLMYEDPFYDVNYTLGGLIALQLYGRAAKVTPLLENGFTAPPDRLLRTFAGIDIRHPDFVRDALSSLQPKIDELADVYRQHP